MSQRRKRQLSIARLFEKAHQPAFVLDDEYRIVAANDSLCELVSQSLETMIGFELRYSADTHEDNLSWLNSLCPPPSTLAAEPQLFATTLQATGAPPQPLLASVSPLQDDKQQKKWLVILSARHSQINHEASPASEARLLHEQLLRWRNQRAEFGNLDQLLGNSSWMELAREQFQLAVQHRPRVLIFGPEGSGKEAVAKALHYAESGGSPGPLIPLDCELLTAELLQSTIVQVKKWLLRQEEDTRGSFLLLNVHQLNEESQLELLGLLDLPGLDLPTLATSNESLPELCAREDFRSDLARRLATVVIELPSLADHPEDLPLLAQSYIETHNGAGKRQIEGLSTEAIDALVRYPWPRNLAELHDFLDEAMERTAGPVLQLSDLPKRLAYAKSADEHQPTEIQPISLDDFLAEIEDELIRRALSLAEGNKTRAAELLGISRARLHRKLDEGDFSDLADEAQR